MDLNRGRILPVIFILVLLLGFVSAQNYVLYSHEISIDVLDDGRADVVERFYLVFPTNEDREEFRSLSTTLGSDIEQWAEVNVKFQPNVGKGSLLNKQISYTEADATYLELSYTLVDALMGKGQEKTNNIEYTLKATYLDNFFETNAWVIPENTAITFLLPPRADIVGSVEPEAETSVDGSRIKIRWEGYKSANRLHLKYVSWNVPSLDIRDLINSLFFTLEGQVLIIALGIIVVIVIIERKKFSARIEDFVAAHSKLVENEEED